MDAERPVRASLCPAAGFGLVDASTGSHWLAAMNGAGASTWRPRPGRRQTRTLGVAIAQLCATFTADRLFHL